MSRTDQTQVCLACLTRMARRRGPRCGSCGGELLDLRDQAAQHQVAARLATARPASVRVLAWLEDRRSWLYLAPLLAAVHPLGLVAAWSIGGPLGVWIDPGRHGGFSGVLRAVGAFVAGGATWIVALLVIAMVGAILDRLVGSTLVRLVGSRARRARRERTVLDLIREPELGDGEVSETRGRVRGIVPVMAPLTGRPCVAWTIACEGPGGDVADGGGGRFEVIADDGVYDVVLGDGELELDDGVSCELGRGSAALAGWSPGQVATPVISTEAILVDGDSVEVVGACERRTFREAESGPALRIRRISRG